MDFDLATADAVMDFWFGTEGRARPEWFRKDAAFDASVRERFGALVDAALTGPPAHPPENPRALLARIVVLDQFPRNLFRGQARAFAGDEQALALARHAVARGLDRALPPLQRSFAYLPFEHSEDLRAQDESVRLFEALAAESPERADALLWARKHQEVIQRFGRFPHRNAALGRASTADEEAYLRQPGSGF
jgi:uncharacterized protein (DUF924 family)